MRVGWYVYVYVSETCRVIINQVKQKLHLVGYLLTRYFKDARYHERKIYIRTINAEPVVLFHEAVSRL